MLGIGANAAVFSLFDQLLRRPLLVHEPDRLVNLAAPGAKSGSMTCGTAGSCTEIFSYPMFRDLERAPPRAGRVGIAAYLPFATTGVVLLIACANVAHLLLARGAGRAGERVVCARQAGGDLPRSAAGADGERVESRRDHELDLPRALGRLVQGDRAPVREVALYGHGVRTA